MEDAQAIVILAKRNLELEAKIQTLNILQSQNNTRFDDLNGYIAEMQKALDYYGHPSSMAGVIKDKMGN